MKSIIKETARAELKKKKKQEEKINTGKKRTKIFVLAAQSNFQCLEFDLTTLIIIN